jgi:hypothetical protein
MSKLTPCAVFAVALVCGCASPPTLPPIRHGDAVAFTVAMSPDAKGSIQIRNEAVRNDMSAGVGSGLVAGGLWGLTCGPFAVLCVPLAAALGGVTGAAAGAVVGVTGALPDDKAVLLRDRLHREDVARPLLGALQTQIDERARKLWQLDASPSATVVRVELQDLLLISTRDERVRCVVQVRVSVLAGDAKPGAAPPSKMYEYVGPYSALAVWLDEGSDFVGTSLASASQQLAAQIVSDLALR